MTDEASTVPHSDTKPDLTVRTVSAAVMLAVLVAAIWFGGWVLDALIILVGIVALIEWTGLSRKVGQSTATHILLVLAGIIYIAAAVWAGTELPRSMFLFLVAIVVATDSGAYFAGRAIGGPKIAPSISPSKTWAGLAGGTIAAGLTAIVLLWAYAQLPGASQVYADAVIRYPIILTVVFVFGGLLAWVAQAGDFIESAMKRKAGVKDSGTMIPGHGGLLDRVDGFLPVMIIGYVFLANIR